MFISQFDGRTLNGIISTTAGGVARNIVDAIGKLQPNSYPYFISTMSDDAIGQFLWNSLEHVVSTKGYETSSLSFKIALL